MHGSVHGFHNLNALGRAARAAHTACRVRGSRIPNRPPHGSTLALWQGMFNIASGLWPLIHLRSFEAVFGPKSERWLVRTVAGLLLGNGVAQVRFRRSATGVAHARQIGVATAVTLAAIDLTYAPTGRISKMYLLDGAVEVAWITAWITTRTA